MHVVVTVRTDAGDEPTVQEFGPWDWAHADRERKRLVAMFTREHPAEAAAGWFHASVVEVAS